MRDIIARQIDEDSDGDDVIALNGELAGRVQEYLKVEMMYMVVKLMVMRYIQGKILLIRMIVLVKVLVTKVRKMSMMKMDLAGQRELG